MLMCLEFPVHNYRPFFSILIELSLYWKMTFFVISYPCASWNVTIYFLNDTYSLVPTSSDSVVLFLFNFCLLEWKWIIPYPIDIAPSVWLHIFGCTSNDSSTQVNNSYKLNNPINCLTYLLCFRNVIQRFIFFLSYTLLFSTCVLKYATYGSMYGLVHFLTYNGFAATEWNIFDFSVYSLSEFSFTFHECCAPGVFTA